MSSYKSTRAPAIDLVRACRFSRLYHRYYTEGIGNGSRAAIHCIILASGRQCSINQHLLSDHVKGTFSKGKDICLVRGFLWCYATCLRGMDIKKCVFLTVNVFRREFFIRPAFRVLAMPLWAYR